MGLIYFVYSVSLFELVVLGLRGWGRGGRGGGVAVGLVAWFGHGLGF